MSDYTGSRHNRYPKRWPARRPMRSEPVESVDLPDWGRDLHMTLGVAERQALADLWRAGWAHQSEDYSGYEAGYSGE